jgi:DnaJ-class molecular chaperone
MGTSNVDEEGDRIAILGVSAQATISEVKNAYKVLIRQNHPDRVQDMSLALRTLAEAETKKINAAYRQALLYVLPEVEAAE